MKYPLTTAKKVAVLLGIRLADACQRIEIVGSIRREKPEVSDVELLFIPKIGTAKKELEFFAHTEVNLAESIIQSMEQNKILRRRLSETGKETFGPLNKLMVHVESGIPVDLFAEPEPRDWWRSLVIRTGPKESNIELIKAARRRGVKVHAYGVGLTAIDTGERIPCRSEEDFFSICGATYVPPNKR